MRKYAALMALTALLAAGSVVPSQNVSGVWTGSSGGISVTAELAQFGTAVSGTGTVTAWGTYPFLLTGLFIKPSLSATLEAEGYDDMHFSGVLDGNTLVGTLNGNGLVNYAVTLTR